MRQRKTISRRYRSLEDFNRDSAAIAKLGWRLQLHEVEPFFTLERYGRFRLFGITSLFSRRKVLATYKRDTNGEDNQANFHA